jgi:hypothetical protein
MVLQQSIKRSSPKSSPAAFCASVRPSLKIISRLPGASGSLSPCIAHSRTFQSETIRTQPCNLAACADQNRRRIARVDIRQDGSIGVVRRPKQSRVAIVSEAVGDLLVKLSTRRPAGAPAPSPLRGGALARRLEGSPSLGRPGFLFRSHPHRGSQFAPGRDREVVEIAPDRSRCERLSCHGGAAQHGQRARIQVFLHAPRNLKFALNP